MSLTSFAHLLESLVEEALAAGLPVPEVCDALAVAGMVLDERRPVPSYPDNDEAPW